MRSHAGHEFGAVLSQHVLHLVEREHAEAGNGATFEPGERTPLIIPSRNERQLMTRRPAQGPGRRARYAVHVGTWTRALGSASIACYGHASSTVVVRKVSRATTPLMATPQAQR